MLEEHHHASCRFDSGDNASPLVLTEAAEDSSFFESMPAAVLTGLKEQSIAMENHHWGVCLESILQRIYWIQRIEGSIINSLMHAMQA